MNARIRNIYLTLRDARRVAQAPERCGNLEILRQAQQVLVNCLSTETEPKRDGLEQDLRSLNQHLAGEWDRPRQMLRWESGNGQLSITWERIDQVAFPRPRDVFAAMLEHGILSAKTTDGDRFTVEGC